MSPKDARGPMQLADTAKRFGLKNPHDPKEAIDAAARYLRDLLRKFGGRLDLAVAGKTPEKERSNRSERAGR